MVIPVYSGIELDVPVALYLNDVEVDRSIVQSDTQSLLPYIDAADLPRGDSQRQAVFLQITVEDRGSQFVLFQQVQEVHDRGVFRYRTLKAERAN